MKYFISKIKIVLIALFTILIFFIIQILMFQIYILRGNNNKNIKKIQNRCNFPSTGPRILCGVYTNPRHYKTKLLPIHNTWAKRLVLINFLLN
jgi:hypothetical protein